jgi:hypothetical protein
MRSVLEDFPGNIKRKIFKKDVEKIMCYRFQRRIAAAASHPAASAGFEGLAGIGPAPRPRRFAGLRCSTENLLPFGDQC